MSNMAKTGSLTYFYYSRSIISILFFGVQFLFCIPNGFTQVAFEKFNIVIGNSERQTILTGFLLGGDIADVAVLSIDEKDDRCFRMYAFRDSTWIPNLDTTLNSEVLFTDVISIDGRDRMITYKPGCLNWFDPESALEQELVSVVSNFLPPHKDEIPHVDISQDVNGDNIDDLVIPDIDGFWVFIQLNNGAFSDPVKIGPPTNMAGIYGADGYRYDPWSQSRIYKIDYDLDGRIDLVSGIRISLRSIFKTSLDFLIRQPRHSRPKWHLTLAIHTHLPMGRINYIHQAEHIK